MLPNQASPPLRAQQIAPLRIFLVEIDRIDDPVGSKAAEVAAQLTPGREQPHGFEIADRDRPDRAFAVAALFVAIAKRDFLALMNLRPGPRHVDAVRFLAPARTGAARRFEHNGLKRSGTVSAILAMRSAAARDRTA